MFFRNFYHINDIQLLEYQSKKYCQIITVEKELLLFSLLSALIFFGMFPEEMALKNGLGLA